MTIYLKLLFVMLVWGGTFTSARLLGGELAPAVSAFLRFLLASSILLLLLYFKEGFPRPSRKQLLLLIGMGVTGVALYNLFFFYGLSHAEASRGSMITATNPLITALGAALIFKERFTAIRVIGFLLCISGAVLIISRGNINAMITQGISTGDMAFIGCAMSWAVYTLLGRFISKQLSSLAVIAYASSFGTLVLFVFAINAGLSQGLTELTFGASMNLLYLSVLATVIGFVWFQDGVKILGASKAAVFIYFMPVSAVFWAYLILHENITFILLMGAVMIVFGIYLVNKKVNDSP